MGSGGGIDSDDGPRASTFDNALAHGVGECERSVAQFDTVGEVPFKRDIWTASLDVMVRTQLRSHDAIHVASVREVGIRDFATLDEHFWRVPDLRVWLLRDGSP